MDSDIISIRCNKKYMNTVIYKISCKDETIKDIYIGQTTNFDIRKFYHIRDSKISCIKLYKFIRDNGGWDNWDMIILGEYSCKNFQHSSKLEWYWWKKLKATLNSIEPGIKYIRKDKIKYLDFTVYINEMENLSKLIVQ